MSFILFWQSEVLTCDSISACIQLVFSLSSAPQEKRFLMICMLEFGFDDCDLDDDDDDDDDDSDDVDLETGCC